MNESFAEIFAFTLKRGESTREIKNGAKGNEVKEKGER